MNVSQNYLWGKFKSFLVFLLISVLFWFFGRLSDTYSYIQSFQIKIRDIPAELQFTAPPPAGIDAQLRTSGFQILANRLNTPTLNLSFSDFQKKAPDKYFFLPNAQLSRFQKKHYRWEWVRFYTDSIILHISKKAQKKVPVVSAVKFHFKPGYRITGEIKFTPDSVRITGPEGLLKNIREVKTESLVLEQIDSDVERKVKLILPVEQENIRIIPTQVTIQAHVQPYTEKEIQLPVKGLGPDDKVFPETVTLRFAVAFDKFSEVKAGDFIIEPEKGSSTGAKRKLIIRRKPGFVKIIGLHPDSVKVWKMHRVSP